MNESFEQLIEAVKSEINDFNTATSGEAALRNALTIASIVGSMRALRELYGDEITRPFAVENGDTLIESRIIPQLLERIKKGS